MPTYRKEKLRDVYYLGMPLLALMALTGTSALLVVAVLKWVLHLV